MRPTTTTDGLGCPGDAGMGLALYTDMEADWLKGEHEMAACKGNGAVGAMPSMSRPPLPERVWISPDRTVWPSGGDLDQVEYVRADVAAAENEWLRGEVAELVAALETVADCEGFTSAGGTACGDLGRYEAGLDEAIMTAVGALSRHRQQADASRDGAA